MPALPTVGQLDWADEVAAYLGSSLNTDGTMKSAAITSALGYTPLNKAGDTTGGIINYGTSSALVDSTTWNARTMIGIGDTMSLAGSAVANSALENAAVLQVLVPSTSSAASYQKTGLLIQAQTNDPSAPPILRAVVGIDSRGIIGAANTTGRAWGIYGQGQILAGGDGDVFTSELVTINTGSDVAIPGSVLSKYGMNNVARGTAPSTVALNIANADSQYWHHGLYSTTAAIGTGAADSFLELVGKFTVRPTGQTLINTSTAIVSTSMLEVQAAASLDNIITIGNNTGSHFFTVQLRNSVGVGKWFVAGATDNFLTGTAAGDSGLFTPTSGKKVHIGGTTSVFAVKNDNTMAFFNGTTVAQQAGTGETVGFTAGGGTTVTDASTFTGNSGTKAYRISDIVKALKNYGLLAAS